MGDDDGLIADDTDGDGSILSRSSKLGDYLLLTVDWVVDPVRREVTLEGVVAVGHLVLRSWKAAGGEEVDRAVVSSVAADCQVSEMVSAGVKGRVWKVSSVSAPCHHGRACMLDSLVGLV